VCASGVVLHPQGYGTAGLRPPPDLIELEPHQGLDEGGFAGGLMPHHDDGGCVEWFLKVLVGEDANFGHFAMAEEGTNGW